MDDAQSIVSKLETAQYPTRDLYNSLTIRDMTTPDSRLVAKVKRAQRARAIRDALGIKQDEMAERLTAKAAELGFGYITYDKAKVSKSETGGREIEAEDALVWAYLDPERRGVPWLVAGLVADRGEGHRRGGEYRRRA